MATSFLSHAFAPGASLSAQYQYVRFALFGSSAAVLDVFDDALAVNTAAVATAATPRTANTCFLAISPPLSLRSARSSLPPQPVGVNRAAPREAPDHRRRSTSAR